MDRPTRVTLALALLVFVQVAAQSICPDEPVVVHLSRGQKVTIRYSQEEGAKHEVTQVPKFTRRPPLLPKSTTYSPEDSTDKVIYSVDLNNGIGTSDAAPETIATSSTSYITPGVDLGLNERQGEENQTSTEGVQPTAADSVEATSNGTTSTPLLIKDLEYSALDNSTDLTAETNVSDISNLNDDDQEYNSTTSLTTNDLYSDVEATGNDTNTTENSADSGISMETELGVSNVENGLRVFPPIVFENFTSYDNKNLSLESESIATENISPSVTTSTPASDDSESVTSGSTLLATSTQSENVNSIADRVDTEDYLQDRVNYNFSTDDVNDTVTIQDADSKSETLSSISEYSSISTTDRDGSISSLGGRDVAEHGTHNSFEETTSITQSSNPTVREDEPSDQRSSSSDAISDDPATPSVLEVSFSEHVVSPEHRSSSEEYSTPLASDPTSTEYVFSTEYSSDNNDHVPSNTHDPLPYINYFTESNDHSSDEKLLTSSSPVNVGSTSTTAFSDKESISTDSSVVSAEFTDSKAQNGFNDFISASSSPLPVSEETTTTSERFQTQDLLAAEPSFTPSESVILIGRDSSNILSVTEVVTEITSDVSGSSESSSSTPVPIAITDSTVMDSFSSAVQNDDVEFSSSVSGTADSTTTPQSKLTRKPTSGNRKCRRCTTASQSGMPALEVASESNSFDESDDSEISSLAPDDKGLVESLLHVLVNNETEPENSVHNARAVREIIKKLNFTANENENNASTGDLGISIDPEELNLKEFESSSSSSGSASEPSPSRENEAPNLYVPIDPEFTAGVRRGPDPDWEQPVSPQFLLHRALYPQGPRVFQRLSRSTDSANPNATTCEWIFKTDPGVPLLLTFKNYTTPETERCAEHHIAVERSNGYEARWCGSANETPSHATFARHEIKLRLYTEGDGSVPTGFLAEVQALDMTLLRKAVGSVRTLHDKPKPR